MVGCKDPISVACCVICVLESKPPDYIQQHTHVLIRPIRHDCYVVSFPARGNGKGFSMLQTGTTTFARGRNVGCDDDIGHFSQKRSLSQSSLSRDMRQQSQRCPKISTTHQAHSFLTPEADRQTHSTSIPQTSPVSKATRPTGPSITIHIPFSHRSHLLPKSYVPDHSDGQHEGAPFATSSSSPSPPPPSSPLVSVADHPVEAVTPPKGSM